MSDGNSKAPGHPRASHGRIHVTNHEYDVGRLLLHDWGEAFLNERNLLHARERTNPERDFGARYLARLKKDVRQGRTVMLAGMHDRTAELGESLRGSQERGDFADVRPR